MSHLKTFLIRCPRCGLPIDLIIHEQILQIEYDQYHGMKCPQCDQKFMIQIDDRYLYGIHGVENVSSD